MWFMCAEAAGLADAVNAGEEFLGEDGAVVGLARLQAVVARAAVIEWECLAEVGEQFGSTAAGALGVARHALELGAGDLALLLVGDLVDEVRLFGDIAAAVEQEAVAGQAVASGAAGLLVVALDVFGQVVVDHPADVGLVDAHAEGDRGADDLHLVAQEKLLVFGAFLVAEPGVVGPGGEAAVGERLGHALGGGARGAIDDAALVLALFHELEDLLERFVLGGDAVGEVGAVETRDKSRRVAQAQVLHDVAAHAFGGRRGERHDGDVGQQDAELGELPVLGAEIVAPLGDAVRLVDGDRLHVPGLQIFLPVIEHETLGRGVEQPPFAAVQAGEPRASLLGAERGVEVGGGDAHFLELIHLILHQRDQGRHHHRQPRAV